MKPSRMFFQQGAPLPGPTPVLECKPEIHPGQGTQRSVCAPWAALPSGTITDSQNQSRGPLLYNTLSS